MAHLYRPIPFVAPSEIRRFVRSRLQSDGGYSFAAEAPSDLEDTYFALRTLALLGHARITERTRRFIRAIEPSSAMGPRLMRYLVEVRRIGGLPPPDEAILASLLQSSSAGFDELFERVQLAVVCRRVVQRSKVGLSFARWPIQHARTADDPATRILFFRLLNRPCDPGWVDHLRGSQNSDGGFGFLPGSTSFLEPTALALRALLAAGSAPADPLACRDFVLRCRIGASGFGRQSSTVPSLESTWNALLSLRILSLGNGAGRGSNPARTNDLTPEILVS